MAEKRERKRLPTTTAARKKAKENADPERRARMKADGERRKKVHQEMKDLINEKFAQPSKYQPNAPVYSEDLMQEICDTIACSPLKIDLILKSQKHFPGRDLFYRWINKYPIAREMYAVAKQTQIDFFVENMIDISEDESRDIIHDMNGQKSNSAAIARDKLKIDTIKWMAERLQPKKWGSRTITDSTITINQEDAIKDLE